VVTFNVSTTGTIICTLGGVSTSVVTETGNYNIQPTDNLILAAAALTLTLPATAGLQGKTYYIKHIATNGLSVIVATTGGATIDGDATKTILTKWTTMAVFTNGSDWFIL
jgi:hypothetical protein